MYFQNEEQFLGSEFIVYMQSVFTPERILSSSNNFSNVGENVATPAGLHPLLHSNDVVGGCNVLELFSS